MYSFFLCDSAMMNFWWIAHAVGAEGFETLSQPVMQQDFLLSRSRGANSGVMINLRGCNFYWLLNAKHSVEILGRSC